MTKAYNIRYCDGTSQIAVLSYEGKRLFIRTSKKPVYTVLPVENEKPLVQRRRMYV